MAGKSGFGKIITSGLTMSFDVNDENSFKGPPTTNLVTDPTNMSTFSNYSCGSPVLIDTEFGTKGYGMYDLGSWNGRASGISLPSPGYYTFSCYYRYLGGSGNNNGGRVYTSGFGIGYDTANGTKGNVGEWVRYFNTQNCPGTSGTMYLISWGGTYCDDFSSWEMTKPQVEAGQVMTPWVDGSRTSTTSLLDLTGTNSIDVSNVTFSSSTSGWNVTNNMEFDGTNDYLSLPNGLLQGTGDFTVCQVLQSSAGNAGGTTFGSYPSSNLQIFYGNRFIGMYLGNNSTYLGTSPWTTTLPEFTTNPTMITAVRQGSTLKFYLDGVLVKTGSSTSTVGTSSTLFRIGANTGGNERFTGNIYTTQVYNRALSDVEISKNFLHYAKKYNIPIKDGSSSTLAAPNAEHLYNLGIRARGTYWIKPNGYGGSAQQVYCDFDDNGGWMLVASNNASETLIPGGTSRNTSSYFLNRIGSLGTSDPNRDYVIGSIIDDLSFTKVRILGFGWDSTNSTYSFPRNLGNYVNIEWTLTTTGSSRYTEKVARANVTVTGTGTISPNASYFILDAVQNDVSLNANSNQSTLGAAGVASASGDPSDGCYFGHGSSEGSFEGWYNGSNSARNSQGYTTWVR